MAVALIIAITRRRLPKAERLEPPVQLELPVRLARRVQLERPVRLVRLALPHQQLRNDCQLV
jgi:hypothetical protein